MDPQQLTQDYDNLTIEGMSSSDDDATSSLHYEATQRPLPSEEEQSLPIDWKSDTLFRLAFVQAVYDNKAHIKSSSRGKWEAVAKALSATHPGLSSPKSLPPRFFSIKTDVLKNIEKGCEQTHLHELVLAIEREIAEDKAQHPKLYQPIQRKTHDTEGAPPPKKHCPSHTPPPSQSEELTILRQILSLLTEKQPFLMNHDTECGLVYSRIDALHSKELIDEEAAFKATVLADDPEHRKKMETLPDGLLVAWVKHISK